MVKRGPSESRWLKISFFFPTGIRYAIEYLQASFHLVFPFVNGNVGG